MASDSCLPYSRDAPPGEPAPVIALCTDLQTGLPPPSWHRVGFEAHVVTAAVEGLAGAFDLRPQAGGLWTVEHTGLAVRGELSVQSDGVGARVGLAIGTGDGDSSPHPLGFMSAVSVFAGGVTMVLNASLGTIAMSAMNLLGPLLAAAATFLGGLIVRELLAVWRRYRGRRWARAYQRRLWPALNARLGSGRIYR